MSFQEKLAQRFQKLKHSLCIGIDPRLELLPSEYQAQPEPLLKFSLDMIESTAAYACCYKINSAFFEKHGALGWQWMQKIIQSIPSEIPIIWDAKRADIGATAEAYAATAFEYLKADAITVSPYMGKDSLEPFWKFKDNGVFILCLTSNPGADDFQKPDLHLQVARKAQAWNTGNLGLVVGATQTESIEKIRNIFNPGPLLIPGIGAQGGDLALSLKKGLASNPKTVCLINVSRDILLAGNLDKINAAAQNYAHLIQAELEKIPSTSH